MSCLDKVITEHLNIDNQSLAEHDIWKCKHVTKLSASSSLCHSLPDIADELMLGIVV